MYSNWSFTGSSYSQTNQSVASSEASTSSTASLAESCVQCSEHRHNVSPQQLPSSSSSSSLSPGQLLLHQSVYRFSHRYLPESLVLYLNVEPARHQESLYGPILEGGQLFVDQCEQKSRPASEAQLLLGQQNSHQLISSVTSELVAEVRRLQSRLIKLAELDWSRQRGKPLAMQAFSPINSGHMVTLHYDLISGRKMTADQLVMNNRSSSTSGQMPVLTASFRFYLLGRCCRVDASQPVDQFYACFKINNRKEDEAVNEMLSKSNRSSKWSFGRFSLKLDSKSSGSFSSKKNNDYNSGLLDRSNDYETIRLDNLRVDFEELMETVRFSSAN